METNNLFEEKIVEVENEKKYYIIKQILYKDDLYLMANELIDEETPGEEIAILKVDNSQNALSFSLEKNDIILKELLEQFSNLI